MAIDGFSFTTIANSQVDPDSPVDTVLATGYRDNSEFLMRWLGRDFLAGAVANHDHDGVNSAAVTIAANTVDRSALKNASETVSTLGAAQLIFSNPFLFGFYPQISVNATGAGALFYQIANSTFTGIGTTQVTTIFIDGSSQGGTTAFAIMGYIQTSPDHWLGKIPILGGLPWIFRIINDSTKEVVRAWEAEDPPWYLRQIKQIQSKTLRDAMKQDPLAATLRAHPFVEYLAENIERAAPGFQANGLPDGHSLEMIDLRHLETEISWCEGDGLLEDFQARVVPFVGAIPAQEIQDHENRITAVCAGMPKKKVPLWRKIRHDLQRQGKGLLNLVHDGSLQGLDTATRSLSDDLSDSDQLLLPRVPGLFIPDGSKAPLIRVMTQP